MNNKTPILVVALLTFISSMSTAQAAESSQASKLENSREIALESAVTTQHKIKIRGKTISYNATAGTQPVWSKENKPIATLFYTYYQRNGVKDKEHRPLLISFNGGPGSGSVWMHMAYTGPRLLSIDDEGYPVQPYTVRDNHYSLLDVADIVFVNPVNTGFSRMIKNEKGEWPDRKQFFGVNQDVDYLAEWINTFVNRNNRWLSPKYLIGESYGTIRVSGLAKALQEKQWMYLNGVVLVSPTDLGMRRDGPVKSSNRLPYFAAAAWHHGVLAHELQTKDLIEVLAEAESFAVNQYLPALAKGSHISAEEKQSIAEKVAYYSGLKVKSVLDNNLDISNNFFWKDLLRDKGFTIGRLDSRYRGIDKMTAGIKPDYNAELTSWLHSFTPAINYYLRAELNYKTDVKYNMFGPVFPWDNSKNYTGDNLRSAMSVNPWLKVMVQSGYYDGATNYFDAKYNLAHLDPSGKMNDRMSFKGYRSGHMMYLRSEDLKTATNDLRAFILNAIPKHNEPARF